ncbi:MAG: PQQ-like beta-propeller repeat protein [Bacteroidetes bacterium]|nr:PQQ-like beta-propeller repeat protein [Bacteroidota bacterium]
MVKSNFFKNFIFICLPLLIVSCNQSNDWSGWRGANRDAKVVGFKAPATWPTEMTKVWQQPVGLCDASPVIAENKLYLHVKQEANELAICLDEETGEQIWQTVLNPAPEVTGGPRNHPGPRSTPSISNGKVFMLGAGGILSCLNAESGEIVWKNEDYTEVPQFFTAVSPLVIGNKCIVHLGGKDNGVIVAFNTEDGEVIWKLEGEPCTYSSPVLMKLEKEEIIVVQTETDLLGLTLEGNSLWEIPTPVERRFYNSSTPIVDGQNIIIAGQGAGTKSFKIEKSGKEYSVVENWVNPDLGVSFNTPVLKNGYLYGNEASSGKLFCLNATTGKTCWADTTKHNKFASTLDLGESILSLPATGEILIFEPNAENYVATASYKVAETDVYAHPLVVGNTIFVKDQEMLTCWLIE